MAAITNTSIRIFVVYALGVMAAMTVSEAVTELGAIAKEFHLTDHGSVGIIMSLPSLMVVLGALLAGYLVDRIGDRIVLLTGALIIIAGDIAVIAAPAYNLLLAGRVVTGVGYVLTAVAAVTLLIRMTTGKQRTMVMALWSTFVPASFLLPFISAGFAEYFQTWRAAFIGHSVLTLVLTLLAALSIPSRTAQEKAMFSRTRGLSTVLKSPLPYLLGISFAADAFIQTGMISSLTPFLARTYAVPPVEVSHWNVGAMLANAVGCLMVGALLNQGVKAITIAGAGIVLAAASALLVYLVPIGFMPAIFASWVFMFSSGLLVGMWALAPMVAPSRESTGATSGLITQLTLVGVFLGPPLFIGAMHDGNSQKMALMVIIGLVACLVALPVWLRGTAPRTGKHVAENHAEKRSDDSDKLGAIR
ncbi:TPA: MFS transporter [Klebsiella pneumoniae]|nr:MFS transporter [Klebsiella pneumoniae]